MDVFLLRYRGWDALTQVPHSTRVSTMMDCECMVIDHAVISVRVAS